MRILETMAATELFPTASRSCCWMLPIALLCAGTLVGETPGQASNDIEVGDVEAFLKQAPPKIEGFKISYAIDGSVGRKLNRTEIKCWLSYLQKRSQLRDQAKPNEVLDKIGELVPDFDEEYQARLALRELLTENADLLGRDHKTYLADLNKVVDAGYFKEYVFETHRRAHWDEKVDDLNLRLDDYKTWAKTTLGDHKKYDFANVAVRPENAADTIHIMIEGKKIDAAEGATWLLYALHRFDQLRTRPMKPTLIGEVVLPDFDEELAARQVVYKKEWKKNQAAVSDATRNSFDAMMKAEEAGFVREFVWTYCHQPQWEEPAGLRLKEFQTWATANIPDHPEKAPTHAILVGRAFR